MSLTDGGLPTPNRQTLLQWGIGELSQLRPETRINRAAKDIRQNREAYQSLLGGLFNRGKVFFTGDAWILQPKGMNPAETVAAGADQWVTEDDVNAAAGVGSVLMFKRSDDLAGHGIDTGSIFASGVPAFQKTVAANAEWDDGVISAVVPDPAPPAPEAYDTDRILEGTVSYRQNQPFLLTFFAPVLERGVETFLYFIFGGSALMSNDTYGGQYCLEWKTSGRTVLHEWRGSSVGDWDVRDEWQGEMPERRSHTYGFSSGLFIIPYGRDRILFLDLRKSPLEESPFGILGVALSAAGSLQALQQRPDLHLFQEKVTQSGHIHLQAATGAGNIHVSRNRLDRSPLAIYASDYPSGSTWASPAGEVLDSPFLIPDVPASTLLFPVLHGYLVDPEKCSLAIRLYNADTHVELTQSGSGFLSHAGQRRYYARVKFFSDGTQTPVLWGYTVYVNSVWQAVSRTPDLIVGPQEVVIEGPGIDPLEEGAELVYNDLYNAHPLLRARDRVRSLISLQVPPAGAIIGHLFEGEIVQSPAKLRGVSAYTQGPSPYWHEHALHFTGLWSRLTEAIHLGEPVNFGNSFDSANPAPDGTGGYLPWLITDAVKWLLYQAGVPPDEVQVPDIPLRLWFTPGTQTSDYTIYPGQSYDAMLALLVREYLGAVLVRDPNAGTVGMWRLLQPPDPTSVNYLARFWLDGHTLGRTAAGTGAHGTVGYDYMVYRDGEGSSWETFRKAPLYTWIQVQGDNKEGGGRWVAELANYDAELTPASPHFLGRRVPYIRVDPTLKTQEAVNLICYLLYQRLCMAKQWGQFVAPLAMVRDTLDLYQNANLLRPLRIYDLVLIRSGAVDYPFLIRSVNPAYSFDGTQFAFYEGIFFSGLFL